MLSFVVTYRLLGMQNNIPSFPRTVREESMSPIRTASGASLHGGKYANNRGSYHGANYNRNYNHQQRYNNRGYYNRGNYR